MASAELHICLWGESNFKNFTATLDRKAPVSLLVLAPAHQHQAITGVLMTLVSDFHLLDWNADIPDFPALDATLTKLPHSNFLLNASSGARADAMQLLSWCISREIPAYLIDDEDKLRWLNPLSNHSRQVSDQADLDQYFQIHHIDVLDHGPQMPVTENLRQAMHHWISRSGWQDLFRRLNQLAHHAVPCSSGNGQHHVSLGQTRSGSKPITPLLNQLEQLNLIERDDQKITFTSDAARFFCNGGWLELYVFDQIRKIRRAIPEIQDVWTGAILKYEEDIRNELDIVFLANNQLHIIEVKTSYLSRKQEAANGLVYKLEALTANLGKDVKGMAISLHELPGLSRKRARQYQLRTLSGQALSQLSFHLAEWIYSTHGEGTHEQKDLSQG